MPRSDVNLKRAVLAVPGSSEKMITKARTIDVDEIFLDLEDSVSQTEKSLARKKVIVTLNGFDEDPKLRAIEDYELWLRVSQQACSPLLPKGRDSAHS